MAASATMDDQAAYWCGELERAKKRFRSFWDNGDGVVDVYRQQKADGNDALSKDKYNILYSSTETIRPNLYASTPIPYVVLRNKDTATDAARVAAMILENSITYLMKEEDFDELMDGVVEDFLLPGLGNGWVRYSSTIENNVLLDEMVNMEYVYWQDFLCGVARKWKQVPWVAKRLWLDKQDATARFGKAKAEKLSYTTRDSLNREVDNPGETAEVWEVWDKRSKTVYWYGDGQPELLDSKPDPLKLKRFFPCPRPIRAIYNTRTFVPRPLYSQYKSQAETLNVLTKRIRLLGEALRVVGLYDGSQTKLSDVLNPSAGNRMIAVDSWALFAQNGGINGSVQWVPIDEIVKVLNELLKAREICKQEIYEITGFSDIVRGVSKASETLGAQNIKANWAGARVKKMQAEIQRFARDLLALAGEVIAEHCSPETLAIFSGVSIPDPQAVATDPNLQAQVKTFKDACDLIKSDIRRLSTVAIETDSTLAADQEAEREDRAKFLAASGAFLQQAVPAMEATPELGPLLGALLLFTVRSFPSSRPIEDEFEKVAKAMASRPPNPDKDGKQAKAAADQAKAQADAAGKAKELEIRQAEADSKSKAEQAKIANEGIAEQNRHQERMQELELKLQELRVREREVRVKENTERNERFKILHEAALAEMGMEQEVDDTVRDEEIEYAHLDDAEAQRSHEADQQAADHAHEADQGEADRSHQADMKAQELEAAQEAQESAQEADQQSAEAEGPGEA